MPKFTKKADMGLGIGGNPKYNARPDFISDNMDAGIMRDSDKEFITKEEILSMLREEGE